MEFTQVPPEQWPDKSTVKKCTQCGKSFGLFRAGSHCRGCGKVFCTNTCLPYRFKLPAKQSETGNLSWLGEPVPVCASCAEKLSRLQEAHKKKIQSSNASIITKNNDNSEQKNKDEKQSGQGIERANDTKSNVKHSVNDNFNSSNNNIDESSNTRRNEEINDQLSTMQELLSSQKAVSEILINKSTELRSENALLLQRLNELEQQQLMQKQHEHQQLEQQLEKEQKEKMETMKAEMEKEKRKLQELEEQRHKEREQIMEKQMRDNTEQILQEQREMFYQKTQTWLQNVLYISQTEVNEVHHIVVEERDALLELIKTMMSEVIVAVKTDVTSQVEKKETKLKEEALLELQVKLNKEWTLKEEQLLKEQKQHYDDMHVTEIEAIWNKTRKEFDDRERKHNAEIIALQKRLQMEMYTRLEDERALHVKEINMEREKYQRVKNTEQSALAQKQLLLVNKESLLNAEMQARMFIQTDEANNLVELLQNYAQTMTSRYFDSQASHQREVDEMKDEFDAEFLEQHVIIIENYKTKLSKVEEEHKQQVSRLREQLHTAESTLQKLQQEKNTNWTNSDINICRNNEKMLQNVSDMFVNEMSLMYDLWLTQYESILAHVQVENENNECFVMQSSRAKVLHVPDNKLSPTASTSSPVQTHKNQIEHQELWCKEEIEVEKRESKRLALQVARSAHQIAELEKANTELRNKLERSEARVKTLSSRLPLHLKTPIRHTSNEEPSSLQLYKSENKQRIDFSNTNTNTNNMQESTNDVTLTLDSENSSIKDTNDKQSVMLQYKEKEWWQFVFTLMWKYVSISSAFFTESLMMLLTETLVHLWKEENKRKEISDRSAFALEQTTSTIKLLQDSLNNKSNELMRKEEELQRATRKMVKQKAHALNCVKRMHALLAHLKEQEELSNYTDSTSDATDMSPTKDALINSNNITNNDQDTTIITSSLQSSPLPSLHSHQDPKLSDKCNDNAITK